jgi:hypothetical protein
MKQGESLSAEETPRVACFFANPLVKYAELHGDRLYAQCPVYRRSVALVEDVVIDLFRVKGGNTHDWMVHHDGAAPWISIATQESSFEPKEWLHNGGPKVLEGQTDEAWQAVWRVDDVTSQLVMLPGPGTRIYGLETYPVDNAKITAKSPACQSLCVRRENDEPFLAVWHAWKDASHLRAITPVQSKDPGCQGLCIATDRATYHVAFGPGEVVFQDGSRLKSDGAFCLVRAGEGAALVSGTRMEFQSGEDALRIERETRGSVSATLEAGQPRVEGFGEIQYETVGGEDVECEGSEAKVRVEGKGPRFGGFR